MRCHNPNPITLMSRPRTIRHVLWDSLRTLYRELRRVFASGSEHGGLALAVSEPLEELQAALGRRYFAPNWEFSYYELEPTEYDQDHIDGVGVDVPAGVEAVERALDGIGIGYERYEQLPPGSEP